jgi:hypothetical protein
MTHCAMKPKSKLTLSMIPFVCKTSSKISTLAVHQHTRLTCSNTLSQIRCRLSAQKRARPKSSLETTQHPTFITHTVHVRTSTHRIRTPRHDIERDIDPACLRELLHASLHICLSSLHGEPKGGERDRRSIGRSEEGQDHPNYRSHGSVHDESE